MGSFVKYGAIGVINTFIGFGIIFYLMHIGFFAETANFIGYVIGFFVSYFLNKTYNFKSNNSHKKDFSRFLIGMAIAYILNLIALMVCYRLFNIDEYLSQLIAGAVYTLSGYVLSKIWIFQEEKK